MRIGLFYFALYASVGITLAYLPPYFQSLGFSGKQIALAVSLQPLLMIVVPPVWGFLADRTRRPVLLLRIACVGAFLAFSPMLVATTVPAVVATLGIFALFSTTLASLIDSVAVVEARRMGTDYARLRLWGSVGFVAASYAFGLWLSHGGDAHDAVWWALAAMAGHATAAQLVRPAPDAAIAAPPSVREAGQLLRRPALLVFFAAAMLHWAAMAPYHMLFAIHLRDLGASATSVGAGFALAVSAEVVVMWRFRDLIRRLPIERLMFVAFASGIVRFLITGLSQDGTVIAVAQALHGLTYGAFYVCAILWLEREVAPRLRATGRALYSSLVYGIGGVLGNAVAGALYDAGGGSLAFLVAAGMDFVPPLLLVLSMRLAAGETQRPAP